MTDNSRESETDLSTEHATAPEAGRGPEATVVPPSLPRGMSGQLVLGTVQHLCMTLAEAHRDDDLREVLRTDVEHPDPLVENLVLRYMALSIHAEQAIEALERVVAWLDPAMTVGV